MKNIKYLFLLLFINSFLFADIDVDAKDRLDALLNKTNSIAKAHISLIEDRALLSTSLATLITNGYIDPNITSSNLYGRNIGYASVNVTSKLLDLDTNIAVNNLTADERGYFLNNYKDSIFAREVYEKSGEFWVKYYYSGKAINVLMNDNTQNTYIGEAEPTSYTTVTSNQTWWDSNDVSFNVKKYVSTNWVNEDYNNQKLNSNSTFSNINNIPLTKTYWSFSQVTSTEQTKPVECARVGATYNQATNRCIGYTSDACDGNYYDTVTGLCYKRPIDYCNAIGYSGYDGASNRCSRVVVVYANKITTHSNVKYKRKIKSDSLDSSTIWGDQHGRSYYKNDSGEYIQFNFTYNNDLVFEPYCDSGFSFKAQSTSSNHSVCYIESSTVGSNGSIGIKGTFGIIGDRLQADWVGATILNESCKIDAYISKCYSSNIGNSLKKLAGESFAQYSTEWGMDCFSSKLNVAGRPYATIRNVGKIGTASLKNGSCVKNSCPVGYTNNGTNCKKETIQYQNVPSTYGTGYVLRNNRINGVDAYVKTPSCSGKVSSMGGVATSTYGNNGICYSNTALYCKTYSSSTNPYVTLPDGRRINCWDTQRSCNDSTYNIVLNYSGANDKCSKFNYSCSTGKLYGLATHSTNNNTLDLFNRISNKNTKATANVTTLLTGNRIVNDNNGAMCVTLSNSTFLPSTISGNYTINGIQKSGF